MLNHVGWKLKKNLYKSPLNFKKKENDNLKNFYEFIQLIDFL